MSQVVTPLDKLFLHFFDVHFLTERLKHHHRRDVKAECAAATRIAILAARNVYLPAASYVESPICRAVVDGLGLLPDRPTVRLVGSGESASSFFESKLRSYDPDGLQHRLYAEARGGLILPAPFRPRRASATTDLRAAWARSVEQGELAATLFDRAQVAAPLDLDSEWALLPQRLGDRAFTPEYAVPILLGADPHPSASARVAGFINSAYFDSFTRELDAGVLSDMVLLDTALPTGAADRNLPYAAAREELRARGVLERILCAGTEELLDLRSEPVVVDALLQALNRRPATIGQGALLLFSADLAREQLSALRKIPSGAKHASAYQHAAAELFTNLVAPALGPFELTEVEMNAGRKRLDIMWPNFADSNFFHWVRQEHDARWVYGEAKNYKTEITNPEIDQLQGRFQDGVTRFGILFYRSVRDRDRLLRRCSDAFRRRRSEQELILPLGDADLTKLVQAASADGATGVNKALFDFAHEVQSI